MAKEKKEDSALDEIKSWGIKEYVILFVIVIVLALIVIGVFYGEESEIKKIGKIICEEYNYTYWYVSGNTVHCYTTNYETGFKIPFEFWIDVDLAKQIYLENNTD